MIKNIIFDFDGVLVDSEILAGRAFSQCLASKNHKFSEHDFSMNYSGNKHIDVVAKLSSRFNIQDEKNFFDEVMAISYSIYQKELKPISGVEEFLKSVNYNKYIGSNRGLKSIIQGLKIVNLYKYFDEKNIFSFDMVDKPKPHPDIFLKVIEDAKIKPYNTIILEDSITGVEAAIAANIKVIGITSGKHWTGRSSKILLEAGAFSVVSNFKEVLKIINKI